jgi:hypothetical protein
VTKEPKLPLNDNFAGKAEGRLGNSIGDRQMLEYIKAGDGAPSGAARRCGPRIAEDLSFPR